MKLKKEIEGNIIKVYFNSSNVLYGEYNIKTQELIIVFKDGKTYKYINVPHRNFVQLERAQSQGRFLNKEIKPKFNYEKINDDYDVNEIYQTIKNFNKNN